MASNLLFDYTNWDNWLVGTWNVLTQKYTATGDFYGCFGNNSTYTNAVTSGDFLRGSVTNFPIGEFTSISFIVNGITVQAIDLTIAGDTPINIGPLTSGDSIYIQGCGGGPASYHYDFIMTPYNTPPGNFWTDFVGCEER